MKTGLESLDTGAPDITYSGNEGPKSPQQEQQMQMAQLEEEYNKYVFEMEEQGLEPMSMQQFMEQIMSEAQMSSQPQGIEGMMQEPRTMAAGGGVMQLVKENADGSRPGYRGDAAYRSGSAQSKTIGQGNVGSKASFGGDDRGGGSSAFNNDSKVENPTTRIGGVEYNVVDTNVKERQEAQELADARAKEKKDVVEKKSPLKKAKDKFILPTWKLIKGLEGKHNSWRRKRFYNKWLSQNPELRGIANWKFGGTQLDKPIEEWTEDDWNTDQAREWLDKMGYAETIGQGPDQQIGGGGPSAEGIASTLPLWQQQGFNSYADWLATQGTGQTAEAEDPSIPTDPVTGLASTNQYHIPGASNFYSNLPSNQFNQSTNMLTLADGGRTGYAGGGITDLRQGYFLGKLVKGITKPFKSIKKIAKSPIGLAALSMFAPQLMGKFIPGMANTGWKGNFLSKLGTSFKKNPFPWISGAAALGGAYTAMNPEEDKDGYDYAEKDKWLKYFSDIPTDSIRFATAADGGRIGYAGGKDHRAAALSAMYGEEDDEEFAYGGSAGLPPVSIAPEGFNSQSFPDDESTGIAQATPTLPSQMPRPQMDPRMMQQMDPRMMAQRGMPRRMAAEGGLMDLGGMEKDYRAEGGFVPLGGEERADDVPARLSKNEFVFTADAVRNAGGGDIDKGAEVMENLMENLEAGGKVSQQSQGLEGAREMFATQQRLGEVL